MHITEKERLRFQQRLMAADELLLTDRHLSTCADCGQHLVDASVLQRTVGRLRSELALAEGEPCTYFSFEQRAGYVNGQLSAAEMALAKSHLEQCAECCLAFAELQAVRLKLTPEVLSVPATQSAWERLRAWFEVPGAHWAWRGLGAVATAVLLVWLNTTVWRAREVTPPAPPTVPPGTLTPSRDEVLPKTPNAKLDVAVSPETRPLVALQDAGRQIALDSTGSLLGLEGLSPSVQAAVKEVLTTQQVKVSPQVAQMRAATVELLGKQREAADFSLLSPFGQVVRSTRPVLKWQALSGASSYYVSVYAANLRKVAASGALTATEWTPEPELERGRTYYWQVRALKDEQEFFAPAPSAPDAKFKILERSQLAEIERASTAHPSHLTLGVLYARAGMLEEAGQEFKTLVAANPHSPVARRILQSFERQSRSGRP